MVVGVQECGGGVEEVFGGIKEGNGAGGQYKHC